MPAFVLRQEYGGRLSIHHSPSGQREWKSDRFSLQKADAEASRARFRDDHAGYCVYSGIFRDEAEVNKFVQLVNSGKGWSKAWRVIERARVDVQV